MESSDCQSLSRIFDHDILLISILNHLDHASILKCSQVNWRWFKVCRKIDSRKRRMSHFVYNFVLKRFKGNSCNSCVDEGVESFRQHFASSLHQLYAFPDIMLLMEANNTKDNKKRKWKRAKVINSVRDKLPKSCRIIGIDAHYGLISKPCNINQTWNDSFVINYHSLGTFGIASYFFPRYVGMNVEIFNRSTEFEVIPDDIKALVLFSSGVSSKGEYLVHLPVQQLFKSLNGNLAIGGAQINDKLITALYQVNYSDDTANYYFKNGPPPYNSKFNPQKMSLIGILFSGPKCESCSISIEAENFKTIDPVSDINQIEIQLKQFRHNLGCDIDNQARVETVAFLSFNYKRHQVYSNHFQNINAGIEIFYKLFPHTMIIGTLTHAQYQHNYWPEIINDETRQVPDTLLPSIYSIASFTIVIIYKD